MDLSKVNLKIKKVLGKNAKKVLVKILFPFRNKFCLFNISNIAEKNKVNLNYWKESANLGDCLSPVIVDYVLSTKNINPSKSVNKTKHLYGVGSVLTAGIQDCTVWGSGVLNATLTYRLNNRKMDIRSVRGPFTRAILMDYGYCVPEVYGDPAILMPEIYEPKNLKKEKKYGLILHKDYIIDDLSKYDDTLIIDIRTEDYKVFLDKLNSVEVIIASSLHGIILAEAYGIPAILLKPQIDMLKYYDYYYGTERFNFPIATNIEEAMKIKPIELPNFKEMRKKLKEVFPFDIYE